MSQEIWDKVDRFFEGHFAKNDPILCQVLKECSENGLPPHNVSACQGMFLYVISKAISAQRILEIGTLGGYSTIWLARSIGESGVVVTIESNKRHAIVAKNNFMLTGLDTRIQLINNDATSAMQDLIDEQTDPFDLIFIDADKSNNPKYLSLSLQLSRIGAVIMGDNVVRGGEVANEDSRDDRIIGIRQYCDDLSKNGNMKSTGIQTVGCKGYDGFTISIVECNLD